MIRRGLLIGGICVLLLGGMTGVYIAIPPESGRLQDVSQTLHDKDGELLEMRLTPSGHWRERVSLEEIDPTLIEMLLAYEDKRFFDHSGVDIFALARAIWDGVTTGRITSGASTLTMQTVRLMHPELGQKSLITKTHQMLYALRLDWHWSKEAILEAYFTLAPYGGNIEGVKAASQAWFQKTPDSLTMSEAALLVALPQSPESRRPDRHPENAYRAKSRVLAAVQEVMEIPSAALTEYQSEHLPSAFFRPRSIAPHLTDRLQGKNPATSINKEWQQLTSAIVRNAVRLYPAPINGAALVVERRSGLVRSYVGSAEYNSQHRKGAVNYLTAIRSPGSTLKPLIYAKGIEQKILTSDTVFTDQVFQQGGYQPTNFDQTYSGEVTLKNALIRSLNIPAITTLEKIGPERFENRIRSFLNIEENYQSSAGLSLAVGGFYLKPEDLANLYLAFVDPDDPATLRFSEQTRRRAPPYLTSPNAAATILGLLTQVDASRRKILFKTGTSHNRQDAWTVMITKDHLVIVWFGTPDNTPTRSLTGRSTAYPVAMQIAESLDLKPSEFNPPIAAQNTPSPPPVPTCPKLIQFPEDGEWIRSEDRRVRVEGATGIDWFLNGHAVQVEEGHLVLPAAGSHRLSARLGECLEANEIFLEVIGSR